MALQDVQASVTTLLNRRDATPALINQFLQQGMNRAQRQLRIPSMERASVNTATTLPVICFSLPDDLLQIIDVFGNNLPLEHLAYRQLQRKVACEAGVALNPSVSPEMINTCAVANPEYFARVGASLFIWPMLQPGGAAIITYYGAFQPLTNPTDENELTLDCPDVLIYGALSFAADYFQMDQKDVWEARFQQSMAETQDNANQLDATGGSLAVQSPHGEY